MPAMTVDERNKRRSSLRFQQNYAHYKDRLHGIMELWIKTKENKWSHEYYLKRRAERVFNDTYKDLPVWIKERLTGAEDLCHDRTYREDLVFCYPHPVTGVITPTRILCDEGLVSQLATNQGNHYWKNNDGTFTHPFN